MVLIADGVVKPERVFGLCGVRVLFPSEALAQYVLDTFCNLERNGVKKPGFTTGRLIWIGAVSTASQQHHDEVKQR